MIRGFQSTLPELLERVMRIQHQDKLQLPKKFTLKVPRTRRISAVPIFSAKLFAMLETADRLASGHAAVTGRIYHPIGLLLQSHLSKQ